jgi:HEPN domain-containing protein
MDGSDFIGLGYNFLQLTINSIEEMEKQGNKSLLFFPGNISDDEMKSQYDEKTKWNDNNISIPVLFNFYHGVELVIKGLIVKCGGQLTTMHKLSDLLKELKKSQNPPSEDLINHFEEILKFNLNNFFDSNNKSVDTFYESFKYPQYKNGGSVIFKDVRGLETSGLELFISIKNMAADIKLKIIDWITNDNTKNI